MNAKPNIVFGEVLFDIFPDKRYMGGAPFNFAFHLHCLGMPVIFISRVGDDPLGQEVFDFADRYNFSVKGIQTDVKHTTGEAQVSLASNGSPKFKIMPDRAYDYIELNPFLRTLLKDAPPLVYYGTLAQRNTVSRNTIRDTLQKLSNHSILFMDLNLRTPFYNRDVIETSLNFCDVLKINLEELDELGRVLDVQDYSDSKSIIKHLLEIYRIKWVCVTKGENGSELYRSGVPYAINQPANFPRSIKDTVGAGDAFSAMLASGLLRGLSEHLILERASLFASEICSIKGALPKNMDFYIPFGVEND